MAASAEDSSASPEPHALSGLRSAPRARAPRWGLDPQQVWLAARIASAAILVVWLIAWPIGTMLALREKTGLLKFGLGYSGEVVILALTNAGLVLAGGYLLRAALRLEATADRLGEAVRGFEPGMRHDAMKREMAALGGEVDKALKKLAGAEQQIRQQVGLIDKATETMRHNADQTTERVAKERQALIDATAKMNAEAEAFAATLAKRDGETADIPAQIARLEAISKQSADQFVSLRDALSEQSSLLRERPREITESIASGKASLQEAQRALMEESERLRSLIEQQKERADSLGRSLAQQSEKLSVRKESPEKPDKSQGGSWKRILDRVEKTAGETPIPMGGPVEAPPAPALAPARTEPHRAAPAKSGPVLKSGEGPAEPPKPEVRAPRPEPKATIPEDEEGRLAHLQELTLRIKAELAGEPTAAEIARFKAGERSLFTQQIMAHDQIELRARLRAAIERDDGFSSVCEDFLNVFDLLIGPIMSADPEGSEAALQEMLRAPLGQLYVAIGTAKGHFA